MHFSLSRDVEALRLRIRRSVDERQISIETDPETYDAHENLVDERLADLRAQARSEGLWSLQIPLELGGGGLRFQDIAACYG